MAALEDAKAVTQYLPNWRLSICGLILVPVVLPWSRPCLFDAGLIHLSSNAHSPLCHFPRWPPTLTALIFPADSCSFMPHPDYPFLSPPLLRSAVVLFLYLNTEWPLLVAKVLTGWNFTSGGASGVKSAWRWLDCDRPCVWGPYLPSAPTSECLLLLCI